MGAMAMGEAQAAIDLTLDWTKERHAFGSNEHTNADPCDISDHRMFRQASMQP